MQVVEQVLSSAARFGSRSTPRVEDDLIAQDFIAADLVALHQIAVDL